MRIALIQDILTETGGTERVLQSLTKVFPNAHVYTLCYNNKILKHLFPHLRPSAVHASWAQNTPLAARGSLLQCLSPFLWRAFDFTQYDVVISNPNYFMSNLICLGGFVHIQYIHSPPKNLYGLCAPAPLQRFIPYAPILRTLYTQAVKSTPYVVVSSQHRKTMLYNLFGIKATLIYPPVQIPDRIPPKSRGLYYLCISRIDPDKSLDLVVEACSRLRLPLKIVGTGTDTSYATRLRKIAGPSIEFLGFLSDHDIYKLYASAIAFLFPSKDEDFGIAPIEAMAHGVPVIAYNGGGAKETLLHGKTGEFFYQHSERALAKLLQHFQPEQFTTKILYEHARKFSEEHFVGAFRDYVSNATTTKNAKQQIP